MSFIRKNIANAFTLGNLFSGSVGIISLLSEDYQTAVICIITSLTLDFFDGFVARITGSDSELGIQLDSLADMVSFGVLPGIVMYKALEPFGNQFVGISIPFEIKYSGLFITLFSCLRLAIFNIDTEQHSSFRGLNTPCNTVLLLGFYYAYQEKNAFSFLMESESLLIFLILFCSWLLISRIKMIAMKFKSKTIRDNYPKIVLVLGIIILLTIFGIVGIPLSILYYILISLIFQKQL